MTACHVMVQVPDRLNGPFAVHVHMALPGGMDLNIDHTPRRTIASSTRSSP